jgi:mono/diheme cytochrome c family protein
VYNGFSINSLLDSIIRINNFDTTDGMLVFECSDGYRPVIELSKMYGYPKGYIAFKDLDSSIRDNWADSIKDKFNPYYLVWDDVEKNDQSFAWPYGLISIKLTSLKLVFKDAYPNNPSFKNGFTLFRTHCMKCHSVNKVGGSMGPEFNVPKNITEYWRDEDIVAFAKNPNAYRRGSVMPAISTITNSDYKEIVAYIRYMKEFKID